MIGGSASKSPCFGHLGYLGEIRWGGLISFRHPEWLVSRLGPHWITHRRVAMPEVESRIAEIEGWLERSCGWQKLGRLHGHRRWREDGRRARRLAALHRRETADEVQVWQKGAELSAPFFCVGARAVRVEAQERREEDEG